MMTGQTGLSVQRLRTAMLGGANAQLRVRRRTEAVPRRDRGTGQRDQQGAALGLGGQPVTVVTFDAALVNRPYLEADRLRVVEAEVLVRYQPAGGQLIEEDFTNLRIADAGTALGMDRTACGSRSTPSLSS